MLFSHLFQFKRFRKASRSQFSVPLLVSIEFEFEDEDEDEDDMRLFAIWKLPMQRNEANKNSLSKKISEGKVKLFSSVF